MPQLLYFIHVDDTSSDKEALDFGTLFVYTCANSCEAANEANAADAHYRTEFLWRQNIE